jgi:hypothetical protein
LELHPYGDTISTRATTHFYARETYASSRSVNASRSRLQTKEVPSRMKLSQMETVERDLMVPCYAFVALTSSDAMRELVVTKCSASWVDHDKPLQRDNDVRGISWVLHILEECSL